MASYSSDIGHLGVYASKSTYSIPEKIERHIDLYGHISHTRMEYEMVIDYYY